MPRRIPQTVDEQYRKEGTPEERYGADNEHPDRTSGEDGSKYDWRGHQAGRGGQEEQLTDRVPHRDNEDELRKDRASGTSQGRPAKKRTVKTAKTERAR